MAQQTAWYQDETFWRKVYPYMFDAKRQQRALREVDGIITLLNLDKDDAILDMGCGDGRHIVELARRGYGNLTGVDSTKYYLDLARQRTATEGLPITFVEGDMLSFRREGAYDAVLSLFSSFGYFETPADNLRVLQNAHDSLKPGGQLLVDVRSKENFAYHFDEVSWSEMDDNYLLTKRISLRDFSVLENHWTIIEGGKATEFVFSHWIYSAQELKAMFEEAGFADIKAYGGMDGSAFTPQSSRLVIVGGKARA